MIFGSLDVPFNTADTKAAGPRGVYGAWIAIDGFYRALLKYGSYDKYNFFLPSRQIPAVKNELENSRLDAQKINIFDIEDILASLSKDPYSVFFTSEVDISKLSYIRKNFASSYFPICGAAYTVSYAGLIKNAFFLDMISEVHPFDSILCISPAQLRAIRKIFSSIAASFRKDYSVELRYNGSLKNIPLGINSDQWGRETKKAARRSLGWPAEATVILCFGRFSLADKMDLYPLLASFAEVVKEAGEAYLVLAGNQTDDGYIQETEAQAKDFGVLDRMRIISNPSPEKKRSIYSASDIFVSPSDNIQESFGLTIIEAMASGLPVVASDWNGYANIIAPGKNGLLIPTYWMDCFSRTLALSPVYRNWMVDHVNVAQATSVDVRVMTEHLLHLIRNKSLRRELSRNAMATARTEYDWRVLIPKYEKYWKRLLARSKRFTVTVKKTTHFAPDYFRLYRHYPSEILGFKTKIAAGPAGHLFWKTGKLPAAPRELNEKISSRIAAVILGQLAEKNIITISDLLNHTQKSFNEETHDRLKYHIMWMLKKDLVKIAR